MEPIGDVLGRLWALGVAQADENSDSDPPEPPCPICRGSGYVRHDVTRDHPDFGKAFPCECKAGEIVELRRRRFKRLSNPGPLPRLTFDNLIPDGRHPETPEHRPRFRMALGAARGFAANPN